MCSLRTGVVHTVYRQAHVQPYIVNRLCVVHEVCFKHGVVPLLVRGDVKSAQHAIHGLGSICATCSGKCKWLGMRLCALETETFVTLKRPAVWRAASCAPKDSCDTDRLTPQTLAMLSYIASTTPQQAHAEITKPLPAVQGAPSQHSSVRMEAYIV